MIYPLKIIIIIFLLIYVIFISMRPSSPNPKWFLKIHQYPIFLITFFIISISSFYIDERIGYLLLIILLGIYFDIVFIIKKDVTNNRPYSSFLNNYDSNWLEIFSI
jgi:hypothetical protein